MLFDIENQLSAAQAFPGAVAVSQNSYAKQTALQDLSIGELLALLVLPTVAAGAGSSVQVEAIQADDAALTTNVTQIASATFLAADLALGKSGAVVIPPGSMKQQYLGARVTITGGVTTMTADIYLVAAEDIPKFKSFPKVVDAAV